MPRSLKTALADPFAFGQHADIPWRLPETLPPHADVARGIAIIDALLQPVDRKHAAYCLSKLLVGFNERKTADEVKLLLAVWIETNGDIPGDLWSAGTLVLLQNHKFGMPKPVHLRDAVLGEFQRRTTALMRAKAIAEKTGAKTAARPFVQEPLHVRLIGLLKHQEREGSQLYDLGRAAKTRRELAALAEDERVAAVNEGRPCAEWAVVDYIAGLPAAAAEPVPTEPPPRAGTFKSAAVAAANAVMLQQVSTESAAALKRSIARQHRAQGRTAYAEQLEREADALAPRPPEYRGDVAENFDIPEVNHG